MVCVTRSEMGKEGTQSWIQGDTYNIKSIVAFMNENNLGPFSMKVF